MKAAHEDYFLGDINQGEHTTKSWFSSGTSVLRKEVNWCSLFPDSLVEYPGVSERCQSSVMTSSVVAALKAARNYLKHWTASPRAVSCTNIDWHKIEAPTYNSQRPGISPAIGEIKQGQTNAATTVQH